MAEGGRDVFYEEKRDNHLNIFKERIRDVRCKVREFEGAYYLLRDAPSTLLFPNFKSIVDDLADILVWLDVCIRQQFNEDEEFLSVLRREKREIREFLMFFIICIL